MEKRQPAGVGVVEVTVGELALENTLRGLRQRALVVRDPAAVGAAVQSGVERTPSALGLSRARRVAQRR